MSTSLLADAKALETARRAALFVLDIDGVLVDPKPSFYSAARATATWGATRVLEREPGPAITDAEIQAFKEIGGWNDDFDLACACTWGLITREGGNTRMPVAQFASNVGGGLTALSRVTAKELPAETFSRASELIPNQLIRERAAVRYAGRARCFDLYGIQPDSYADLPVDGLWMNEPVLCDPASLKLMGGPFAIFTGRNGPEAEMALERVDLFVPPELRAVDDGQTPRKPAPDALLRLAELAKGPLVFIGDSIDDERAALAYEALRQFRQLPPLVFVRIIEGDLDEPGSRASVVASSLDAFARALRTEAKEQVG